MFLLGLWNSCSLHFLSCWDYKMILSFWHHWVLYPDSFSLSPPSLFPSGFFFLLFLVLTALWGNHPSCSLGIQLEQTSAAHLPTPSLCTCLQEAIYNTFYPQQPTGHPPFPPQVPISFTEATEQINLSKGKKEEEVLVQN